MLTMPTPGTYPSALPGSVAKKRRAVNRETQLYTSAATSAICSGTVHLDMRQEYKAGNCIHTIAMCVSVLYLTQQVEVSYNPTSYRSVLPGKHEAPEI